MHLREGLGAIAPFCNLKEYIRLLVLIQKALIKKTLILALSVILIQFTTSIQLASYLHEVLHPPHPLILAMIQQLANYVWVAMILVAITSQLRQFIYKHIISLLSFMSPRHLVSDFHYTGFSLTYSQKILDPPLEALTVQSGS